MLVKSPPLSTNINKQKIYLKLMLIIEMASKTDYQILKQVFIL